MVGGDQSIQSTQLENTNATRLRFRRHPNTTPQAHMDNDPESEQESIPPEVKLNLKIILFKGFVILFIFRIFNSMIVSTWFDPDETWQSLEVAHNMVFGNGYLTWEYRKGIRGALHPMIFALLFKLLKVLKLDDSELIYVAPRLVQAFFASICDFFVFMLSFRLFGLETAKFTLICTLVSWFNFYCLVRTYSNSMEASLTMIALYFWPFQRNDGINPTRIDFRISLAFAAISCVIRPTSVLLWGFLGIQLLLSYPNRVYQIFFDAIVTGFFAIGLSIYVDFLFYKRFLFIPWEFLKVNVVENIAEFYGTHSAHWYFTQGIPLVIFTFIPICMIGIKNGISSNKAALFWACLLVVISLSFEKHKEFRFLMPLVGPMMIYAGRGLYTLEKLDIRTNRVGPRSFSMRYLFILIATNFLLGWYFSKVHKRGVIDATIWLRNEAYTGNVGSVLFLMPCHSMPFYSHFHLNLPMRFITCEPPLG